MKIDPTLIPEPVRQVAATLRSAGFQAWIVGGCVRDLLRGAGNQIADWDLTTEALPGDVQSLFPHTIPTGIQHGTVTVMIGREGYEVTTLRGEGAYSDGRRPDEVFFVKSVEEDLARRDFTVNAIAADPVSGEITDPWGGRKDLQAKVIRAVGNPMERFKEDGLRVLRAARFCAALQCELERSTEEAIRPNLETFSKVASERILAEWVKAVEKARWPSTAFYIMKRTGILDSIGGPLAELEAARFSRAMTRLDSAPRNFPLAMAAVLLEARASERAIEIWLRAMKTSNADRELIKRVALGLREAPSVSEMLAWEDSAIRRWASNIGVRYLRDAELVYLSNPYGSSESDRIALRERLRKVLDPGVPLELKGLAVSGDELQEHLGIPPSRKLGELLKQLLEFVLDDPARNEKQILLTKARTLL